MTTVTLTMPPLDPVQEEIRTDPARFKVFVAGRRRGKSLLGSVLGLEVAATGGLAWWIWPTHKLGRTGWKRLRRLALQIKLHLPAVEIREVDRAVVFPHGGEVQLRSAEDPDSLVGEGLDRAIFDETGIIQERAWTESVEPALMDCQGDAYFLGTPKGKNWFHGLYRRGQAEEADWRAWHQTSFDNPFLAEEEKARVKADHEAGRIPERIWRQEYMAEFIDDAGEVFRRVVEAATVKPAEEPEDGHEYVIGVDWGKHEDFTVLTVVDLTDGAIVYLDRFNQIDYTVQRGRLMALAERFRPVEVVAEKNSMGEPLCEELARDGLPLRPFTTTNATKAKAIEALALAFENGSIKIIPDDVLIGELQAYECEQTASGLPKYGAPSGMHDDCVMSAALAWSRMEEGGFGAVWL